MMRYVLFMIMTALACLTSWSDEPAVKFSLQWPEGVRFVQEVISTQQMDMDSSSFPSTVEQEGRQRMVLEYGAEPNRDGEATRLSVRVADVEVTMDAAGRTIEFNSKKKMEDADDPISQLLAVLKELTFSFTVDDEGNIGDFSGTEPLNVLIAQQDGPVRDVLEKQFSEGHFMRLMAKNVVCPWLPRHTVRPGESWTYEESVETGTMGEAAVLYTYTISDYDEEKGVAELAFEGQLNADTGNLPEGLILDYLKADGTIRFDVKRGRLLESALTQQIAMTVAVEQQSGSLIEIKTRMRQKTNMRLLRVVEVVCGDDS